MLQFYDILQQLGFSTFLDQFVLRANDNLVLALQRGLDESQSGILIWSSRTEDSKWCEKEFATMEGKAIRGDFHYGVAKLDKAELPTLAAGAFPNCGTLILGGLKVLIGLGLGYGSRVL